MIAKRAARLAAGRHTPETSDDEEEEVEEEVDSRQQQQPGVHFKLTPSVRTPVRPRTSRTAVALKSTLKQSKCEMLTPAAPRTRRAIRAVNTEPVKRTRSCRSEISPPSCLPTPSDTAPPSPTPGTRKAACPVCGKLLLERSVARHLTTVHRDNKPLQSSPATPDTGPSSGLRGRRKRSSPLEMDQLCHSLPRRLRSEDLTSTERLGPCPVCGTHLAKSAIPKHVQDVHSPSSARRTRSAANMEEAGAGEHVARAVARVSVSSDSPEKIRNFDSPGRPRLSREAVGNIVATFKKGLAF